MCLKCSVVFYKLSKYDDQVQAENTNIVNMQV